MLNGPIIFTYNLKANFSIANQRILKPFKDDSCENCYQKKVLKAPILREVIQKLC